MQPKAVFRFERLDVWHKSVEFAREIYKVTSAFPKPELYGLTSQLRRASTSISANIAEGSSRVSDRDFSRFVEIAFGSLCETVSFLRIAQMENFVTKESHDQLYEMAAELSKMLSSFRSSLGKWIPEK